MTDPFYTQSLPSNVEAEKAILGAILLNNSIINQAVEMLSADDFFLVSNRVIYGTMVDLYERHVPVEFLTLTTALRDAGELDTVGGGTYISELLDGAAGLGIKHVAAMVKDKAMRRALLTAANQIVAQCFDDEIETPVLLDAASQAVFSIGERERSGGFRHIAEIAELQLQKAEELTGSDSDTTGIPSGFFDLDRLTAGFQKQDLVIVAARPSMGKTAIALTMAQHAARTGSAVGVFSLEMSGASLVARLLCSEARVDAHRFRTGHLGREDWAKLADALGRFSEMNIFIDDSSALSVTEMRAKARRLKSERGLDLLMVDYLQLMRGKSRTENRQQEVSQISRDLKSMAKDLDVPVIALSQLSRATESRTEHRPQLSDLRDSGSLEQDADLVCFIYREEVYSPTDANRGLAELIVSKQRNGPIGKVDLAFIKEFTRFENMYKETGVYV